MSQLSHILGEDSTRNIIRDKREQLRARGQRTGGSSLRHTILLMNQFSIHFIRRALYICCPEGFSCDAPYNMSDPAFALPSFYQEGTHLPSTIRVPQLPNCFQLYRSPQRYIGRLISFPHTDTCVCMVWCGFGRPNSTFVRLLNSFPDVFSIILISLSLSELSLSTLFSKIGTRPLMPLMTAKLVKKLFERLM